VPLADFTPPPAWAGTFEQGGFRLLDVEELSTPLAEADSSELAEAELEQVRYWRPSTGRRVDVQLVGLIRVI
jgi:hypothetical protein